MKLPRAFRHASIPALLARLGQGLAACGDPFLLEHARLRRSRPADGPASRAETAAIAAALARLAAAEPSSRAAARSLGAPSSLDAPAAPDAAPR